MELDELCEVATEIAESKGFVAATVGEDMALIHSEVSEALEAYRDGNKPAHMFYVARDGRVFETMKDEETGEIRKPCGVPSEMADIVIRVAHFCGKHKAALKKAVEEKLEYNRTRPAKHGGKVL